MAIPFTTGVYNDQDNTYSAPNTATWANVTSWGGWTQWVSQPAAYYTVSSQIEDRGVEGYFNIQTQIDVVGTPTYRVFTSNSGAFNGEEIVTTFANVNTIGTALYGRYYIVEANIATYQTSGTVSNFVISTTDNVLRKRFSRLQTSTLSTNANGAIIPMDTPTGAIVNIQITCWDEGNTAPLATDTTHYYMETPIYRGVMPYITSRDPISPTFQLRDLYLGTLRTTEAGHYVDISVEYLPYQVYNGLNINPAIRTNALAAPVEE